MGVISKGGIRGGGGGGGRGGGGKKRPGRACQHCDITIMLKKLSATRVSTSLDPCSY